MQNPYSCWAKFEVKGSNNPFQYSTSVPFKNMHK